MSIFERPENNIWTKIGVMPDPQTENGIIFYLKLISWRLSQIVTTLFNVWCRDTCFAWSPFLLFNCIKFLKVFQFMTCRQLMLLPAMCPLLYTFSSDFFVQILRQDYVLQSPMASKFLAAILKKWTNSSCKLNNQRMWKMALYLLLKFSLLIDALQKTNNQGIIW